MRNATHIQIAFYTRYPAFDHSRAPDFKQLIEIAESPEFELLDLFNAGLNVDDSVTETDEGVPTDSGLNSLLDFHEHTESNSAHIKKYCLEAQIFYRSLHTINAREFDQIYSDALAIKNARQAKLGRLADENEPFSYKSATADLSKWLKRPLWTIEQATAISLNKNPSVVTFDSLKKIKRFSPFVNSFYETRDIIQSAVRAKLFESEVSPAVFMNWALVSLETLMPEVRAAFLSLQTESTVSSKKLNSHERTVENNLLEIFAAVFYAKFGCNPFSHPIPEVTDEVVKSVLNDFSTLKARPRGKDVIKLRLQEAMSLIRARNQARVKLEGPADEA